MSDEHRDRVRERILDAAIECFAERGIRETTMAHIISASGLSAGALYSYFGGKHDLTIAAVERAVSMRTAELAAAIGDVPLSPGKVLAVLNESFMHGSVSPGLVLQLWGEAANSRDFGEISSAAFAEIGQSFQLHLARWARHASNVTDVDAWAKRMVPVLQALAQGLILQQQIFPHFDRDTFVVHVDELFEGWAKGASEAP